MSKVSGADMKRRDAYIDRAYEYSEFIRIKALEMGRQAGKSGAHLGGSFSAVEIIATLYGAILNIKHDQPDWEDRDRFIASKRHCYLALYPALLKAGMITERQLCTYHDNGGLLAGYPWNKELGLDFSGGSLGMGLSVGIGMALAGKRRKKMYKTYVLLGDGECNEGAIWEGFMSASKYKLDKLVVIIDYNKMQFDGANQDIMPIYPLKDKLEAFGWCCCDVNGHSIEELYDIFNKEHKEQPMMIIANTVKGYGLPSIENKAESHHAILKDSDYEYMMDAIRRGKYDRIK